MVIHLCHILCMCAYGRVWLWYWLQQQSQNYQENAILAIPSTCKVLSDFVIMRKNLLLIGFACFYLCTCCLKEENDGFLQVWSYNCDHNNAALNMYCLFLSGCCLLYCLFHFSWFLNCLHLMTTFVCFYVFFYVFRCPVDRLDLTTQWWELTPVSAILSKKHVLVQS